MKQLLMCLMLCALFMLGGCGQEDQQSEETAEPSSQSESESAAPSEASSPASEEEGQAWPDVVPSDVPALEGVTIEGFYPQIANEKEYTVNFSVSKEDAPIVLDYIQLLTDSGFVENYKTENKFGFDYSGSNEKYDVFINLVYENVSKLNITVK